MTEPRRLRELDGDLGAAFRSADADAPDPGAKRALLAALGTSVGVAGATKLAAATTVAKTAGAAGVAPTAAGAGVTAKASVAFLATKWIVASVVVVGGAAATTYAVRNPSPSTGAASKSNAVVVASPRTAPAVPTAAPAIVSPEIANAEDESAAVPLEAAASAQVPVPPSAWPSMPSPSSLVSAPARVANPPPSSTGLAPHATAVARDPLAASAPAEVTVSRPSTIESASDSPSRPSSQGPNRTALEPSTVPQEIAVLDRARRELASGRAADAVATVEGYRSRFPAGVMEEESRVLEIEALVRAGRSARARELGAAFLSSRPSSPLAPRVRRALDNP